MDNQGHKMYKLTLTAPKIVYGAFAAFMSFVADIQTAMLGLFVCIAADTITGFIAAPYRNQRRTSYELRHVVPKIITYFAAGLLVHICEVWVLPSWAANYELARIIFSFFAGTEIMSCFENMKDITGLRIFDLLTFNFKTQIENKVGITLTNKQKEASQKTWPSKHS